ncbi:MAG: hypothetical protein JOY71_03310 [Acetobacteraceae bacterium]|nr:hypothetical protein [Acetobacteraceae bacterium]MBV8521154.1 hypothetical protein [Acetobacteraceae bacterium]
MARHLPLMIAACLLPLQTVHAQHRCASPADQQAFELTALRSELMVIAVNCHEDEQYNEFMRRYQPYLATTQHELDTYFKRQYGRRAQQEEDAYITSLANAQATEALKQGSDFCSRNLSLFKEAKMLPTEHDLAEYAAGKDVVPGSFGACEPAAPTPVAARGRTAGHATKKGAH